MQTIRMTPMAHRQRYIDYTDELDELVVENQQPSAENINSIDKTRRMGSSTLLPTSFSINDFPYAAYSWQSPYGA